MNRIVAFVGVCALLSTLATTAAATNEGSYADDFQSWGYYGSTGTLDWPGPWYEWNDDGDSSKGAVHVDEYSECPSDVCVHIENEKLTGLGMPIGVKRYADTGIFSDADLYYVVSGESVAGLAGTLRVQVSTDSGANWVTIDTHQIRNLDGETIKEKASLREYLCDEFAVRFLVSGIVGGYVFLDDVVIEGDLIDGGGSTTTTSPSTTTTEKHTTTTERPTTTTEATTTTSSDETSTTTRRTTTTEETTTTLETTSTTEPPTTTSTEAANGSTPTTVPPSATTTTSDDTSTTDEQAIAVPPDEPPPSGGGPDFGLRQSRRGIQANMGDMMFAHVDSAPTLKPVDASVSFTLVVEAIETSWVWMVLFGLVLAWAIISDLDRRWLKRLFAG